MKPLFVDAGYIIALEAIDDQHHHAALLQWRDILKSPPPLVTTTYVLDEIVTFFRSRGQHAKSVEVGNRLIRSASIELVHVNQELFFDGCEWFQRHPDKSYSLTDCISFVVMNQRGIDTALAFDKHFVQAGFEKRP